jgi:DNA polymerase-3 subunit alpha
MKTPERFVGLHAHDGFSTFDGLDYPQEHFDFVRENGMNALAITNHGHMNSFAHAYLHVQKLNKAGANFKFIPGCEMYVHPDLNVWQIEYDLKQARKKGRQPEIERLERLKAELATPLFVTTDGDDEIVDIAKDEVGLTVENEEETKSNKFFDPIKRRHHLVVLPRTSTGLQRLFHLVSRGYQEGFYRFPRVDYQMIKEASKGGHLMISTACIGGPMAYEVFRQVQGIEFDQLGPHLLNDYSTAERVMTNIGNAYDHLVDSVGNDAVMLELQFNKLPAQHLVNRALIEFANQNSLQDKLIVTCDSHYSRPEHWKERELYRKLGWMNHKEFNPDSLPKSREELKCELYPKNAQQVWDSYRETTEGMDFYDDEIICEAVERTHDIAHEMIGDIQPDCSRKLPSYVIPKNKTADQALIEECKKGLMKKGLATPEYIGQLKYELRTIKDKQFSEYFLTTKAIIDLARKHMFVGPGRGSGAGSLVNYVLGITDVDPMKYGLLFERFLSPDRMDMPDIDTDIGDRDKLLELMREKFGKENIVPISNYNTFKLKSLVKDISRFYGIEFKEVNKVLSTLDNDVKNGLRRDGVDVNGPIEPTLEWALKYSVNFMQFISDHPEIAEPIDVLFKQNKALGRHAGGVIVSENIAERMPLILARGETQTPWVEGASFKHLENFGWVKFDLLGLETLRIIERTIELILRRQKGYKEVTFGQIKYWFDHNMADGIIDFNDQSVYKNVYHKGRWAGIFQCTNAGAQQLFKKAKPQSIIDIATLTSIYRPGPLGANVDRLYLRNKRNYETQYDHPMIEEILKETFGCIIFQEQVMELANRVAGIPKDECNSVRKMMKPQGSSRDALAKAKALEDRFVGGCIENGVKSNIAHKLFDDIMLFASYGFNKSHAVAYAINSYYCAWLMTHYEEEWLCAYLESMEGNPDKRGKAFSEVQTLGYEIVPIDINYAEKSWTILEGKKFMPSFRSCKGIGDTAIDEIMENRPYKSVWDMFWNEEGKWKLSKFNKRAVDSLLRIKAMESMNIVGRGKLFENYKHAHESIIPNWMKLRKSLKRNPREGQDILRSAIEENAGTEVWNRKEIIQNDMNLLGSVSVEKIVPPKYLRRFKQEGWLSIDEYAGKYFYWLIVVSTQVRTTKTNKKYLRCKIMGANGKQEWMNIWSWDGTTVLQPYTVCVAEVAENPFGKSTRWSRFTVFTD